MTWFQLSSDRPGNIMLVFGAGGRIDPAGDAGNIA